MDTQTFIFNGFQSIFNGILTKINGFGTEFMDENYGPCASSKIFGHGKRRKILFLHNAFIRKVTINGSKSDIDKKCHF